MLKRNGEDCDTRANYPAADGERIQSLQCAVLWWRRVRLFNERATTLSEIEKQSPGIAEQVTSQIARDLPSLTVMGKPESEWKIRHVLFKSSGARCSFVRAT